MFRRAVTLCLLGAISLWGADDRYFTAFWNVENLFDTVDDPRTNDEEFTPTGKSEWSVDRLNTKYQHLAQVINAMNEGQGPDILGLAEVENRMVVETLVRDHLKRKYTIIHQESPDERGIDCAILFDASRFTLIRSEMIPIALPENGKTRDIVHGEFVTNRAEKNASQLLHVFVNHWPSRYGGMEKTDPLRKMTALVLREHVDLLLKIDANADILIMGDLNDYPDNASVLSVLAAKPTTDKLLPGELYNSTWPMFKDPAQGTYMYRGEWNVLDQVILSQGLLDNRNFSWVSESTGRFLEPYQLQSEGKYSGYPNRTYGGGRYLGGYSDHLPVYCRIKFSQ